MMPISNTLTLRKAILLALLFIGSALFFVQVVGAHSQGGIDETDTYGTWGNAYNPPAHTDTCDADTVNQYSCPALTNKTCTDVKKVTGNGNPDENTWMDKAPIPVAITSAAGAQVNGKVYVIGGCTNSRDCVNSSTNTNRAYVIATNSWELKTPLPSTIRLAHEAVSVGTKIYVIGGWTGGSFLNESSFIKRVDIYDTVTNTWSTGTQMPFGRLGHSVAAIGTKIYVTGGQIWKSGTLFQITYKTHVYDTANNSWDTTKADSPIWLNGHNSEGVTVAGVGKVFVFQATPPGITYEYNTATNVWSARASIGEDKTYPGSASINGKIHLFGGYAHGSGSDMIDLKTVKVYDPATNVWGSLASMAHARAGLVGAANGCKLYAIGGAAGPDGPSNQKQSVAYNEEYTSSSCPPLDQFQDREVQCKSTAHLNVTKTGNGTVLSNESPAKINCGGTCHADYNYNATPVLTATPDPGWVFSRWGDGCTSSSGNVCNVTMTTGKDITATFTQTRYLLTVNKSPVSGGTVVSSPLGINCGSDCTENYNSGTPVTLTATLSPGYVSVNWSSNCAPSPGNPLQCTTTMDAAKTVTATFNLATLMLITGYTSDGGTGSVSVRVNGVQRNSCTDYVCLYGDIANGDAIVLGATADTNSIFVKWVDGGGINESSICPGGITPCSFIINANTVVYAQFRKTQCSDGIDNDLDGKTDYGTGNDPGCNDLGDDDEGPNVLVTKNGAGTGTVTSSESPAKINCGSDCTEDYNSNTSVTLTATPNPSDGSTFGGWTTGCDSSSGNTCVVNLTTTSRIVNARFDAPNTAMLTVAVTGSSDASVSATNPADPPPNPPWIEVCVQGGSPNICTENYTVGTPVTLTASVPSGQTVTWTNCTPGAGNTCLATMDVAKTVTATFSVTPPDTFLLTVNKNGTGSGIIGSSPMGISCGYYCTANFPSGTVVNLTAIPDGGSTFVGWSPNCIPWYGQPTKCSTTMDAAKTVTATFNRSAPNIFTLTTGANGTHGKITAPDNGTTDINCHTSGNPSDCTQTYNSGTQIILRATADTGYTFTGWSGGVCSGNNATCSITMDTDKDVIATFSPPSAGTFILTTGDIRFNGALGLVYVKADGVSQTPYYCSADGHSVCLYDIANGANVELAASNGLNSLFIKWVDADGSTQSALCSDGTPCNFIMDAAQTVYAQFRKTECTDVTIDNDADSLIDRNDPGCLSGPGGAWNGSDDDEGPRLSVTVTGTGSVSATIPTQNPPPNPPEIKMCVEGGSVNICTEHYDKNTPVTLTATIPPDQSLAWDGCTGGTGDTCRVTMDQSRFVRAMFTPNVIITQCNDGIDNDGDGPVDMADPECQPPGSANEGITAYCVVDPEEANINQSVTWSVFVRNACGTGNTTYVWYDHLREYREQPIIISYSTPGRRDAYVVVTNSQQDDPRFLICGGMFETPQCTNSAGGHGVNILPPPNVTLTTGHTSDSTGRGVVHESNTGDTEEHDCPDQTCRYQILYGSSVYLYANPDGSVGTIFDHWVGNVCNGSFDPNCIFNIVENQQDTVRAHFRLAACADGLDNDGDGRIDYRTDGTGDSGCSALNDDDEGGGGFQCSDGVDNDIPPDGLRDAQDPGCFSGPNGTYNPNDDDETDNPPLPVGCPAGGPEGGCARCNDGVDNDADNLVDYAGACVGSLGTSQVACGVGDNTGVWYAADPFCQGNKDRNAESFKQLFQEF